MLQARLFLGQGSGLDWTVGIIMHKIEAVTNNLVTASVVVYSSF